MRRVTSDEGLLAELVAEGHDFFTGVPDSGLKRLIDPGEMGNLFKVLALSSPGLPVPAGFAEASSAGDE